MASVRLTFLGSGDAFASGGRAQACLHLDGGAEPLLLDCGATGLMTLKAARFDPASIGWVALSHLHGDHFAGLPWLILDGRFSQRTKALVVAGPVGVRDRVERTFECLYPGASDAERAFETRFLEYAEGSPTELGPAVITPFEVSHGGGAPAYALRVEYGGATIAYSGDTEWTDALIEVTAGADLFVCECNFFEKTAPGHLDYQTLLEHRSQLGCERIVLTHMNADMLARLDQIEFETAHDGATVTLDG